MLRYLIIPRKMQQISPSSIGLNSNTCTTRKGSRKESGRKMQSAKEKVSDMAASAKAGMEKTKATVQEKVERMTTRDPIKKDMATQKKEERVSEAERQKQMAYDENAAARHGESWMGRTGSQTTAAGIAGYGTGGTTGGADLTGGPGGYGMGGKTDPTTGTAGYGTGGHGDYTSTGLHGTTPTTGYEPQDRLGSQYPAGTNGGGGGRVVGVQDRNVAGGASTGYGSGSTI